MKAIVPTDYGSAGVLELDDVAMPVVGDDEVMIRVRAAGADVWHLMTGRPYLVVRLMGMGLRRPRDRAVGRDVAGIIEAAGKNITQFQPGDEVFGAGRGAFAEYASARADEVAPKPANLTFEQAAPSPSPDSPPSTVCATREGSRAGRRC